MCDSLALMFALLSQVLLRLQMDLDNRKTESRTELKQMDIFIEVCVHREAHNIAESANATVLSLYRRFCTMLQFR